MRHNSDDFLPVHIRHKRGISERLREKWDQVDDENGLGDSEAALPLLRGMAIGAGGFVGLILGAATGGEGSALLGVILYGTLVAVVGLWVRWQ